MNDQQSFTGRRRRRTTSKGVMMADVLARVTISFGGVATIAAVLGVCLFLVWVVIPLFLSAEVGDPAPVNAGWGESAPLHTAVDEYQAMGWVLLPDGRARSFLLETGEVVSEERLCDGKEILCTSFLVDCSEAVLGLADGTVEIFDIRFESSFPGEGEIPQEIRAALAGKEVAAAVAFGNGIVQLTPEGQHRVQRLMIEPVAVRKVCNTPVRLVAHTIRSTGPLVCALGGTPDAPELIAFSGREKEDFLSGGKTLAFGRPVSLPIDPHAAGFPAYLAVSGTGRDVYVAWEEGLLERIRCDSLKSAFVAEKGRLVEPGLSLTAFGFILGAGTLVWGDSEGSLRGGFPVSLGDLEGRGLLDAVRDEERTRLAFAATKELARSGPAVVSLAPSSRSRLLLSGCDNGRVAVYDVTSQGRLAVVDLPSGEPVELLAFSPREDGLLAATAAGAWHCTFDPKHPEANLSALFLPVWYEGYGKPQHMWQSTSGTDDFEPKLGLMPLIFGSIKATLYAMLFGVPLALLAAVYSSEFLHPRAKAAVKPTIELMASMPSVVLGFLAALVFAPFVEKIVPSTLALFVTVPTALLLAASIWQILPAGRTRVLANWRPLFMVVPLAAGGFIAFLVGPLLEDFLFAGDIKGWLAWGTAGVVESGTSPFESSTGGWFLLLLPLSGIAASFLSGRLIVPMLRRMSVASERTTIAWLDLCRFFGVVLCSIGLALAAATILDRIGFDLRGDILFWATDFSPLDTYVQRNALIVGFVMGFAIIPIIYTIADDALLSVPEHLRSASLGAGATTWQTTVRIVIPTAMSGLFSAVMIGLGRAVGETMIVLMALGNTPIMDWNLFNGARTLSANIAVELPEAVRDSTHYRTLFLSALVLFAITFVINTVAEMVRIRFRKKAYQL